MDSEFAPLVSVIIPMYNVENYIAECLDSTIAQTYKNLDIVIVDDGSTDRSNQIASEYQKRDSRIKIIKKTNGGLSDARNAGIKNSNGDFLFFLDSDDFLPAYAIEYLVDLIKKHRTKIAVGAHTILKDSKKIYKGLGAEKEKLFESKDAIKEILLDREIDLSTWAKLYDKSLFTSVTFPVGKNFEDTATTYKLFFQCDKIAVGGNPVYFYRIRENSITTSIDFSKKYLLIENTKEMCKTITEKYPDMQTAANRRLVWAYFSTLNQVLKSKNKSEYKREQKEIVDFLLSQKTEILSKDEYEKKQKIAIRLLSFGTPLYNLARKICM